MLYAAYIVERITWGREQHINSLVENAIFFILRINALYLRMYEEIIPVYDAGEAQTLCSYRHIIKY